MEDAEILGAEMLMGGTLAIAKGIIEGDVSGFSSWKKA